MASNEFYYLLDLQQKLRRLDYDKLNLLHLDPLRQEVDRAIERIMALGRVKQELEEKKEG